MKYKHFVSLTLKMTSTLDVDKSVTINNNSPFQDYTNPDGSTNYKKYVCFDETKYITLIILFFSNNHVLTELQSLWVKETTSKVYQVGVVSSHRLSLVSVIFVVIIVTNKRLQGNNVSSGN